MGKFCLSSPPLHSSILLLVVKFWDNFALKNYCQLILWHHQVRSSLWSYYTPHGYRGTVYDGVGSAMPTVLAGKESIKWWHELQHIGMFQEYCFLIFVFTYFVIWWNRLWPVFTWWWYLGFSSWGNRFQYNTNICLYLSDMWITDYLEYDLKV